MAKKKRGAPSKTCPECQTVQHVATRTCKECGHAFVSASASKKTQKSQKSSKSMKRKVTTKSAPAAGQFDIAIDYIRSAGGISEARKILDTIETIKELP